MAGPPEPTKKKLFGREFYESLGSPKMILAPMVDRSEFAWRMLTRSFMESDSPHPLLAYSPMFHARLFKQSPGYRLQHFEATRPKPPRLPCTDDGQSPPPDDIPYLDGNPALDRPLIVQFCANDPDDLLQAARAVEPFCDAVDLNLGCPQGIARKGHYGAFLQEHPDLIYKLINTLHRELSIPVTAKFRIQETKEKTLEYARMILSAGASIISVHGRRREQKGHNTGLADWSYIRYLRDNLPPDTVIFANGNILNHGDIERCLEATGADGVMSAEGNLCDPTIFTAPPAGSPSGEEDGDCPGYWVGRDGKGGYRVDFVLRRYMDIIYRYVLEVPPPERKPLFVSSPTTTSASNDNASNNTTHSDSTPAALPTEGAEEKNEKEKRADNDAEPPKKKRRRDREDAKPTSPNLVSIQGHLFQLLRALVSKHTHIRDALSRCRAGQMTEFENIVSLVEGAVQAGLQEYAAFPERFEAQAGAEEEEKDQKGRSSSKATVAQCKRPWWVCQPYVRPLPEEALQIGAMQPKKRDILAKKNEGAAGKVVEAEGGAVDGDNGVARSTPDGALSGSDKENCTRTPAGANKLVSG